MTSTPNGRRGGLRAAAAVAFLLLTGCGGADQAAESAGIGNATSGAPGLSAEMPTPFPAEVPPVPPGADSFPADPGLAVPTEAAVPPAIAPTVPAPVPLVMAESLPVSLSIPAITARSQLISLDVDDEGSLEVPPGKPGSPAGWYRHSPTPGEPGPAVILGHVNAEGGGPGIFADLRELQAGDEVEVSREDGSTAVFSVQYGEQYPKDAFPTEKVYGNTEGPELRLITCDGYDPKAGTFDDNYVVYARLVR